MSGEPEPRLPEMANAPIVRELGSREQWVCWKLQNRNGKSTKIPKNPNTGLSASVTNPDHWTDFVTAHDGATKHGCDGVGFVFTKEDPYVGVDLDHCRDSTTGELTPEAQTIVDRLGSYTEISPSGYGLHIIVKGRVPDRGRRKGGIEVYSDKRYFTVTGNRLDTAPDSIEQRDEELQWLYDTHLAEKGAEQHLIAAEGREKRAFNAENRGHHRGQPPLPMATEAITAMCNTDPRFMATWNHSRTDLTDQSLSAYDLSLAHQAISAGMPDADVWALIIAHRTKHGTPDDVEKAYRHDYIVRTIDAAKRRHNWQAPRESEEDEENSDATEDPLLWLGRQRFFRRIPMARIRKLGKKRGHFDLILTDGTTVELGPAGDVLNPRVAQAAIADATGVVILEFTRAKWRPIAAAIFAAAEIDDIGIDSDSEARDWLAGFLSRALRFTVDLSDSEALAETLVVLRRERVGCIWTTNREIVVQVESLVYYVTMYFGARTGHKDVRLRLRRLGFRPDRLQARLRLKENIEIVKARVWISPPNFDPYG